MPEGHPTDDTIAAILDAAIGRGDHAVAELCRVIIGERAAHTATKAAARRVEKAIVRYATVTSLEEHDPIRALELNREVQDALRALAALASGEFGESSE